MFWLIPDILRCPDVILCDGRNRKVFARFFAGEPRPYAVVIEDGLIIVTVFRSDKKYLKRFKILWRTRSSLE